MSLLFIQLKVYFIIIVFKEGKIFEDLNMRMDFSKTSFTRLFGLEIV